MLRFEESSAAHPWSGEVQIGPHLPNELIQALYDLTPAEARIAQVIAAGDSIVDHARLTGVSHETVRKHVKALLAKTGLRRQGELTALISAAAARSPKFPTSLR